MVISIALLGYGASGTFLALMRDRLEPRAAAAFAVFAALFGDHRGRLLRARGAAAVQCAGADLGPRAAALSGRAVRDPVRAVLLRRDVHRPGARLLCRAGRAHLPGRSARRGRRGARHPGAPVPGRAEPGARADRRARSARGRPGQPCRGRRTRAPARARLRGRRRSHGVRAAARVDRPAALAVQGPEPGVAHARRRRSRSSAPARSVCSVRCAVRDPVPPRAGAEPEQSDRAGRSRSACSPTARG